MFLQYFHQYFMVDIGEEFPDVAFQDMAGFCVVSADFMEIFLELVDGSVRAFVKSAGI